MAAGLRRDRYRGRPGDDGGRAWSRTDMRQLAKEHRQTHEAGGVGAGWHRFARTALEGTNPAHTLILDFWLPEV